MTTAMGRGTFKTWLIWYLRQPFRMIVWFMETFAANRARLAAFTQREKVTAAIKMIFVATFFVWLGVFALLSKKEDGDRLTCAVVSLWPGAEAKEGCVPFWQAPASGN